MMILKCAAILLALSLAALTVSCGDSDGRSIAVPIPTAAPVPSTATAIEALPATATPQRQMALSEVYRDHYGRATASLEERVYLADVVVKARLVSAASDVLTFTSIEYIKGSGPKKRFTVRASTRYRDTQWDNQDAILFLTTLIGETEDFEFTDTTEWDYWTDETWANVDAARRYTGSLPIGYHVKSRNPVWLPVEGGGNGARGGSSGSTSGQSSEIIVEYDSEGAPETVTQAKLSGLISQLSPTSGGSVGARAADSTSGRFSAEDVKNCIIVVVGSRRALRDLAADGDPWIPPTGRFSVDSGAGRGTELFRWDVPIDHNTVMSGSQKYNRHELSGSDAYLFNARVYDDDNDSRNGYTVDLVTRRPLPAGVYRFKYHTYLYFYEPCGYHDETEVREMFVTVTAPRGTLHEAFFDPATTTAGVGYLAGPATTAGVLKPAEFSEGNASTAITGLKWQNGSVELSLSPFVSLGDHKIKFIALDGSTTLALRASDATANSSAGTLTWVVVDRPWSAGDKLMLRIGPAP